MESTTQRDHGGVLDPRSSTLGGSETILRQAKQSEAAGDACPCPHTLRCFLLGPNAEARITRRKRSGGEGAKQPRPVEATEILVEEAILKSREGERA